jgi:hypothetical protein
VVSCPLSPSPGLLGLVSGERIAPNQCTRIAKLRLIEAGWACGDALALKGASLARNRVISSVGLLGTTLQNVSLKVQDEMFVICNLQRNRLQCCYDQKFQA